jgi:rod shape-determining protein MreC
VLFLISSSPGKRSGWNPVWQVVIEITAPFQNFTHFTINAVEDFWLNYFQLVDVRQENLELKQTVETLKMENSQYRERLSTHKRLTALLQFEQATHHDVLAAQVIGLDPTGWFKSVIINKGETDGLELDMPVVDADGIVGRIVALSPKFAKVLLIIDQNSAIDCLVQRSRDRGIVKGLSREICEMDYMEKSSDVAVGDIVVASGLGGVFPKGVPVGNVTNVKTLPGKLFMDIEIRPAADFSKLEEVLVVLQEKQSSDLLQKEN